MSTARVDPNTMTMEISGELLERFYAACHFTRTPPSLVLMQMVERFVEGEETKQEALNGHLEYWEFVDRRRAKLWAELQHRIDYGNAPAGGSNGTDKQEQRLSDEIDRIIGAEWEKIEQS